MMKRHLLLWTLLSALPGAVIDAANFSFQTPYSLLIPALRDEVEKCSVASGFSFATGVKPTVPQLSRMCDQPNCATVFNEIVPRILNKNSSADSKKYARDAFAAFGKGFINYCWFFRTPDDACPADPMLDLATRLPEQDTACRNATAFSFKMNATELGDLYMSRLNWYSICTTPSCSDLYTRFQYYLGIGY